MNDIEYLLNTICDYLQQNEPCVMALIVNHSGSTPRHRGSKMVIDSDGLHWGTIGGSLLEAAAIKQAKSAIKNSSSALMEFNLENGSENSKGMICGGKALVLLDFISPSSENREFFKKWSDAVRGGRNLYLVLSLKKSQDYRYNIGRNLLFHDGTFTGNSSLQPDDLSKIRSDLVNVSGTTQMQLKDINVIIDPIIRTKKLYCIGAGHVAKPTAHLAAMVGFDVIVIDDRDDFANKERFPEALETRVIEDYQQAYKLDEIDKDTFITILTRGHLFDRVALEQALRTEAYYIGMMASKKKRDSIFAALKEKGFKDEDLSRVHSPIGLAIDAETPEELAVSIISELIKERAQQQK